jgi:hypothetical protein
MSTITVSMVDNAFATICRDENVEAILEGIKGGRWSDKIEIVRRDFANGVKEKGTIEGGKAAAHAATPGGCCFLGEVQRTQGFRN